MKNILKQCYKKISLHLSNYPKLYTHFLYFVRFKKLPNLKNPTGLNQKILWLKFHELHKEIYTICADKYAVRDFVKKRGCGEILNELLACYESPKEINYESLPNKFAIKCNHGAGYNIICDDKNKFDSIVANNQLEKWLNEDFSKLIYEPQYKNIPRKIIIEKYIANTNGEFPDDYKFYCFNGEPIYVMLCQGRKNQTTKFYYFDMNWKMQPLSKDSIDALENGLIIDRPEGFDSLIEYSKILSKGFKFVRADFYLVDSHPIFGELTFTPSGGLDRDRLQTTDKILGDLLDIKGGN